MRFYKYLLGIGCACGMMTSCNDDYLEKFPETNINGEVYFKTSKDLEIYSNTFYDQLPANYEDIFSDNIGLYTGGSETDNMLRGQLTKENVGNGTWDKDEWKKLRNINYFLTNAYRAEGNAEDIDHYVGIGRFFRAWYYFDKVKRFGAAPWYNRPLETNEEGLYKGMDSREVIMDSVMNDLEFAVAHIKESSSKTRLSHWAALQLMARVALHEGTYRKYHTELNLQASANAFLQKAKWAAGEIMVSGLFDINGNDIDGYNELFTSGDLSNNPEMILFLDFDKSIGRSNNTSTVFDWQWSLSKSLADSYLKADGTPATSDADYTTREFVNLFNGRDARMGATIMYPGYIKPGDAEPKFLRPTFGGLIQIKFYPPAGIGGSWDENYNDIPVFRYAETLLIYAEAKAELGEITPADLRNTVNRLRERGEVAPLTMNVAADPVLVDQYPDVTGANADLIREIRRERRVELACEGFRYDDLMRWKAGDLLARASEGIYVPQLGALDVTGDGDMDIAILKVAADTATLPDDIRGKVSKYYLFDESGKDNGFYLSDETSGFIRFSKDKTSPRSFIAPKYYYRPIPKDETDLNPNLHQPAGWE